jgi:hypothetical protein
LADLSLQFAGGLFLTCKLSFSAVRRGGRKYRASIGGRRLRQSLRAHAKLTTHRE